ncbi:hypothetical protein WN943_007845 [Citrus x changshan-huyou]
MDNLYTTPGVKECVQNGDFKNNVPEEIVVIENACHFIHQEKAEENYFEVKEKIGVSTNQERGWLPVLPKIWPCQAWARRVAFPPSPNQVGIHGVGAEQRGRHACVAQPCK